MTATFSCDFYTTSLLLASICCTVREGGTCRASNPGLHSSPFSAVRVPPRRSVVVTGGCLWKQHRNAGSPTPGAYAARLRFARLTLPHAERLADDQRGRQSGMRPMAAVIAD